MEKKQSAVARIWELGKSYRGGLVMAIILALVGVAGGMVPFYSAAQVIIGMLHNVKSMQYYLMWCVIALAGFAVRTILYNSALASSHKATFSILKEIRLKILAKLPKMPLGTILDTSSGKLKQIIVDQVDSMETTLAHLFPEMSSNIAGPVLIIIYLFVLDWRMALIAFISIPVGMFFMMMIMAGYGKDYEGAIKTTTHMNDSIVEYIGGIEVIKAYNQGKSSYKKFSDSIIANASYYYNWMKKCQFGMALANAIMPTTLITVLPIGYLFYLNGSLSVETFITCIILSLSIVGPLISAMNFTDSLAKDDYIVQCVDEILKGKEQVHSTAKTNIASNEIKMENVTFGYHDDKTVLHNVNLSIPGGSMTALVGPSGGGKSTIAKLIAGFWDAKEGSVKLGNVDEKDIPLEQLYNQAAFVTQDNFLFDDTIMENIRLGNMSASDEEVIKVAKAAGCDDFIRSLEKGYNTNVGGGGAHLSGGERQRIAIARAMLKNAPIVILDEATAYIDPENEAVVQKSVAQLVKGKTVIVIAHRLSTITNADQIVVVKDGSIEATGKHEELLKKCPLYNSMWNAHIGTSETTAKGGRA